MRRRALVALALIACATVSVAEEVDPVEVVCSKFDPVLQPACVAVAGQTLSGEEAILEALKEELTKPELLNTGLAKQFGDEIPLGLEFKGVEATDGGTVLGLGYDVSYAFENLNVTEPDGKWSRRLSAHFNAMGTITENSSENPRNFLETKLNILFSIGTAIPKQDKAFQIALTNASATASLECNIDNESTACQEARQTSYDLLDQTVEFLNHGIQYYEFGLDAGYETDQKFDASQTKFGAFFFGQYENWGSASVLPFDMVPAVRLGVERVNPGSETPRAMAGDDSDYLRASAEASLWIPINSEIPLAFTFNYRHYREIDAEQIVRDAELESYNLRTFALRGTKGLFVSFSSGRLPFDLKDDNVVELGWKTHFF